MWLTFVLTTQLDVVTMLRVDCEFVNSSLPFPHPDGDCTLYYVCLRLDGNNYPDPVQHECPEGKHFSKRLLGCYHPDVALCSSDFSNLTCNSEGIRLAHPNNCSRFFVCDNDRTPIVNICPYDLHFSSERGECVPKSDAKCDPLYRNCNEFDDPMRPTLLVDPANCAAFYKCHNGQPMPLLCPTNLYFSVERSRCEYPYYVDCKDGVRPAK